ncbi:MAG TPA: HPr family phosphocarrier protein [Longimicrobiales bacterium]|nr:HPr family phosphocarrier protein [Longimicrobiales bacterium]
MSTANEASQSVLIRNRYGLHARPAAEMVKVAGRFRCDIWIRRDDLEVNGKSIMGLMMLAAEPGCSIAIRAQGEDADAAVQALVDLVDSRFGED